LFTKAVSVNAWINFFVPMVHASSRTKCATEKRIVRAEVTNPAQPATGVIAQQVRYTKNDDSKYFV
jgi:hypothetical protein